MSTTQQQQTNNSPTINLPVGISNFKKLITGKYLFADKTLFIKDIIENGAKVIVITRPRRFGKTLNLSMLYYFLRKNHSHAENLFEGLNISKDIPFCKEHQQQYPVIFISFKDIKEPNFQEASERIEGLIKELYIEHRYLLEGDVLYPEEKVTYMALLNKAGSLDDLKSSIKLLSSYLERKFNQSPIILIDEYDTPIQQAYLRGYYQDMIDLMRSIFGKALKDNDTLGKAIITGITRIAQESLFSGVNNLFVYTLLEEKYGQYFGFTEEEVLKLLTESKQTVPMASIQEWYNGYQIGKYLLYNPWSIICCLYNNGELEPYWVNTSSNGLISKLLSDAKPYIKKQLRELLQGNTIERPLSKNLVFADIETDEEALWTLLLYTGYLKVLSHELASYCLMAKLAIPNKEVRFVYDKIVTGWFRQALDFDSYLDFTQSLINGDMNKLKQCLSEYIIQSSSYFDFNNNTSEKVFHAFILGLVVGLRNNYTIHSNRESGLGRFDVIFIPKNNQDRGILLEFKTSDTPDLLLNKAQEALTQIKDKFYVEIFKQHNISSVLAIGLAFCGKKMDLAHEIISIPQFIKNQNSPQSPPPLQKN